MVQEQLASAVAVKALVDWFREEQLNIARLLTLAIIEEVPASMSPDRIDASVDRVARIVRAATESSARKGLATAEQFFEAYCDAVKVDYPAADLRQVRRVLESREYGLKEQADYLLAVRSKERISEGHDPVEAFRIASDRAAAVAARSALDAPTLYVAEATGKVRGHYRRRVAADCCSFCAVLASVKYRYSDRTREFKSHPYCRCTTEPVLGVEPSREQAVAEQAWQMVLDHEKQKKSDGQRYFTNREARRAFRHLWDGWKATGRLDEGNIRERPQYVRKETGKAK